MVIQPTILNSPHKFIEKSFLSPFLGESHFQGAAEGFAEGEMEDEIENQLNRKIGIERKPPESRFGQKHPFQVEVVVQVHPAAIVGFRKWHKVLFSPI